MTSIYKIMTAAEHAAFVSNGLFDGSPIDHSDGYIHMSTNVQVAGTLAAHFAGVDGLVLVRINPDATRADIRWEPSRGGQLFPHLYRPLRGTDVLASAPIALGGDGMHQLPPLG